MIDLSLTTQRSHRSTVRIASGLHRELGKVLEALNPAPSLVALVSDRDVGSIWMDAVEGGIEALGLPTHRFLLPVGEEAKSLKFLGNVWDRLLAAGMDREGVVMALGGGVVGDVAGLAAATFKRGVRLVHVPTTLLAQVDSALGGKNGINRSAGKNLVGTFWQPDVVAIDPELLGTLPEREFRSGLAEVVKYGFIRDPEILEVLNRFDSAAALRENPAAITDLIQRSVQIKLDIVEHDEREAGHRALLNFGHTTGHAIEAASAYEGVLHGEAVAIGMVAAAFLAVDLQLAEPDLVSQVSQVLTRYELPTGTPLPPEKLLPYLLNDKKRRSGHGRWVLVRAAGSAEMMEDPPDEKVLRALEAIHQPDATAPPASAGA